jgi:excisionase family DNA binding protein
MHLQQPMQPPDSPTSTFYTALEFATAVNLSYPTVLRLLKRKKLKCLPHCRHKRIPASELERWQRGDFS